MHAGNALIPGIAGRLAKEIADHRGMDVSRVKVVAATNPTCSAWIGGATIAAQDMIALSHDEICRVRGSPLIFKKFEISSQKTIVCMLNTSRNNNLPSYLKATQALENLCGR